jgi:hypothetical protein
MRVCIRQLKSLSILSLHRCIRAERFAQTCARILRGTNGRRNLKFKFFWAGIARCHQIFLPLWSRYPGAHYLVRSRAQTDLDHRKRGNRCLRVLFMQAAWVVLMKPRSWEQRGLKHWIEAAEKRLHRNVLAIALANKLARIAWSVLAGSRTFEASKRSGLIPYARSVIAKYLEAKEPVAATEKLGDT